MMAWNGSSHAQNVMLLRNDVESGGANSGDTTSLVAMLSSGLRGLDQRQEQHSGGPKRPFYAMFDGLDDTGDGEVADDSGGHVEKKRRLTVEQVRSLEMSFEVENRLEPVRKMQLAQELGLQPRQVAVWFQNRRARWKTKQLERDYDILKAAYESLAEENKKLKAQLERLVKADEGKEEDESEDVKEEEVEEPAAAAAGAAVLEDVLNNPKRTEIEQAASGGDDVCTPDSPTVVSSKFKAAKEESPISDGYNSEVMDAFSPHAAAAAAVTKPVVPAQGVENCHEQAAAAAAAAPAPVKEEPCGVDSFPQMNYRLEDPAGLLLEEPSYNCFFAVPEEEQGSWPWWDWS